MVYREIKLCAAALFLLGPLAVAGPSSGNDVSPTATTGEVAAWNGLSDTAEPRTWTRRRAASFESLSCPAGLSPVAENESLETPLGQALARRRLDQDNWDQAQERGDTTAAAKAWQSLQMDDLEIFKQGGQQGDDPPWEK